MRSQKLLIVSATMLACTTVAGVSLADNTTAQTTPTAPGTTVTSQTVMTPSSPSVPATSTTTTSQGAPGATTTSTTATTPTSTTMTTSADDVSASSATLVGSLSPPPSGESMVVYTRRTPNTALLITGSAFLVSTFVTTAALAGANGPVADKDLYIPIVGPWINIAERDTSRENNTRDTLLIAGSGVLQGAGAVLALMSFFVPEKVPAARITAGNVNMQITPQAGPGSGGLGAIGTF